MSASVIVLPVVRVERECAGRICHRCGGARYVTFDQLNEAERRWAPFGAVWPCPACGLPEPIAQSTGAANGAEQVAEVIPFEEAQRRVARIMAEG
jgi:hypothetical protein